MARWALARATSRRCSRPSSGSRSAGATFRSLEFSEWPVVLRSRDRVGPMTQPSGWYDDPQDPSQLRYWDGVVWSSHVTPKISPTAEQSHIGMPYGVTPAAARPQASGSQGAQGLPTAPGGFGSPQQGP